MKVLKIIIYPLSLLYGVLVYLRNKLYDWGIFSSHEFETPVISVGNLVTGGTGKSPHTEYLIRLLNGKYSVATLSRGYGRNTSDFILATASSSSVEIGDEPKQFKKKFPDITVAVDNNRAKGIKKLLEKQPAPDIILLDDAFQHRRVAPGMSVLLTDYSNLFYNDSMLPSGNLREFASGYKRADIIVVTKTPELFSPIEKRRIQREINPGSYQKVYFSYIKYGNIAPVFGQTKTSDFPKEYYFENNFTILLMTGIANASPLEDYLRSKIKEVITLTFSDHHEYNMAELLNIKERFHAISAKNKIILTTEKDAMRLEDPGNIELIKDLPVYYLPIEIDFHDKDKQDFDQHILEYVKRDSIKNIPSKFSQT